VKDLVKKLFINSLVRETRVALLEDQKIVEYLIERPIEKRVIGNIYKGKVENVLPGMQAAFVDIGIGKNAFLYVDDIYPGKGIRKEVAESLPPVNELLRQGEEILVQVNKEPVGTKGARVTTNITIPGRYLVYLPYGGYVGVSRRIEEEYERERLKEIGEGLIKDQEGLIIRTVCEGISENDLIQDMEYLREQWLEVFDGARNITSGELIFQEMDMIPKVVRDLMTGDIEECIIDDRIQFQRLKQEMRHYPELNERLVLYTGVQNIFDYYQISTELDRVLRRKVWLKSGGYIIFDQTEALSSIDVNTGKFTGHQNLEETVLRTNLEAAKEIARQLRLRDIGGIIIIDFIDMVLSENQEAVLRELEDALKHDRTKSNVVGLTSLGLVEMTRKKMRQNLLEVVSKRCSHCEGKGYTLSEETVAAQIERMLLEYRQRDIEAVLIQAHPFVVSKLMGRQREDLNSLEKRCGFKIYLHGEVKNHIEESNIVYVGDFHEVKRQLENLQQQGK
jgi:ribonuclease G